LWVSHGFEEGWLGDGEGLGVDWSDQSSGLSHESAVSGGGEGQYDEDLHIGD